MLGEFSQIAIGTSDVAASVKVYEKLGFKTVATNDTPIPFAQLTDGSLYIVLRQDGMSYIGPIYFTKDIAPVIEVLNTLGATITDVPGPNGRKQIFFQSPDGLFISVLESDTSFFKKPEGYTFRDFPQEFYAMPEKFPNEAIGLFGEFCHQVKDLNASVKWWNALGFETKSLNEKPYPWAIMDDGLQIIGLHQTTDFTTPAITYFAPDMVKRIEKLRAEGLQGLEDWTGTGAEVGGAILTTPEGQKFFLFAF